MTRSEKGVWKLQHTFDLKGMYHLRFSSKAGGFKPDDVPILHTYANDPPEGVGGKRAPAPALALGIAVVGLAAWPSRRRR